MSGRSGGTGTNQEAVRRHNLGTLLRHVHQHGEISRAELTSRMGLNRSTIGDLVGALEELGLIEHALPAAGRRTAGRPSAGVRIAGSGPYVVAVDLGVDRAVVARVGLGGQVWERAQAAICTETEAWQVGATVASLVRHVVSWAPEDAVLLGIGISVPGLVRRSDGLVRQAPNLGWRDVSFGSVLLAALDLDVPVRLANDADLGALAEHNRGAGVGVDDLVYVSGNVGVGAGVITGGVRLQGAGGHAGEVGHLGFDPGGKPCHCGSRGCWETVVGAHAIAAAIDLPPEEAVRLGEALDEHDVPPAALRPIAANIGRGLAAVVNAYNPSLIILGGYFRPLHRLFSVEVGKGLAERAMAPNLESVRLTVPGLGTDSVLLGAAEIALEPVFVDPVASVAAGVVDAGARVAG
ncbi:ROK family transcriptional regulator [Nocardioides sp. TF02-7]|uniref:ROK family transcriptional regulator n=1 Tax=Nocardioides sp. TF02-7 TaxID=2917724 RepID=UPI001F05BBCB|nr:ROK family transcriptional regulator [Nocardioides sp. TF02-7]UMG93371.1 ROK family protein [Nocardioides sp. TF02-7]